LLPALLFITQYAHLSLSSPTHDLKYFIHILWFNEMHLAGALTIYTLEPV